MTRHPLGWMTLGCALLLGGCTLPAPPAATAPAPAAGLTSGATSIVVSANPQATEAGLAMLRAGGTAIDAAIAVQAVLGLVEPQASGLLGGSVTLIWNPATGTIDSYDGMATAPAAATRAVALGRSGKMLDPRELAFSARAVGVPGVLPALWAAHQAQGRLAWAQLFEPAIRLATDGAAMPAQLHDLLADPSYAAALGALRAPYLAADGAVIATGQSFRNPAYAGALARVARLGPDGLYAEGGAAKLLDTLGVGQHESLITEADLRAAQPRIGHALCAAWQAMQVCTAPAPAMGGIVMLQILGTVAPGDPADPAFVHRFLEASRLAEADRRRFLADPAFMPVPVAGLLDPAYLTGRAALIAAETSIARPRPGEPAEQTAYAPDPHGPQSATSEVAVIDADGRALTMTTTINLHFGARLASEGMILNNALLNFAPPPPTSLPGLGGHYANEMAPGKRPLSPVAPVIVLDAGGKPLLVGGGAGGGPIPDTMAMALIDVLVRNRTPLQALAAGHFHAADPDHVALETGTEAAALRPALEAVGQRVELESVSTGNALLLRDAQGWSGASDPRRDGGPARGLK